MELLSKFKSRLFMARTTDQETTPPTHPAAPVPMEGEAAEEDKREGQGEEQEEEKREGKSKPETWQVVVQWNL